jgi:PadR family transcriptional regulator, regulatory protein PadR
MDSNLLKGNLDIILLATLESGEQYGLELTKAVNARTDGALSMSVGSLYPALHRLEAAGFVVAEERTPPRGGTRVRYYQLTEQGGNALRQKREQYQQFDGMMQPFLKHDLKLGGV